MTFRTFARLFATSVALVITLAACGGSNDDAAPSVASVAVQVPTTNAPAVDESVATTTSTIIINTTTPTIDTRTDEEKAVDLLDLMLAQLRADDLVGTADCVVERLESEGIPITGQGAPEIIATLGCDPSIGAALFPTANFGFDQPTSACVADGLTAGAAATPLTEAESFFSSAVPPAALLETIATDCGVTVDELESAFFTSS